MHKMQISLALFLFTLIPLQIQPVWGADNGVAANWGADKSQALLFEKSFPTETGERLKFNGYAGTVKINSWCRNMVKIRIFGSPDAVKYLNFKISSDEMGINIGVRMKNGNMKVKNLNLRYEICIPRDYDIKVNGSKKIEHKKLPISEK